MEGNAEKCRDRKLSTTFRENTNGKAFHQGTGSVTVPENKPGPWSEPRFRPRERNRS